MPRRLLLLAPLSLAGCGFRPAVPPSQTAAATAAKPTESEAKRYTRDEFRKMLMGKTQAEVIEVAGKPDTTQDFGSPTWYYKRVTADPVTGKPDYSAQVVFGKNGRVESVNY